MLCLQWIHTEINSWNALMGGLNQLRISSWVDQLTKLEWVHQLTWWADQTSLKWGGGSQLRMCLRTASWLLMEPCWCGMFKTHSQRLGIPFYHPGLVNFENLLHHSNSAPMSLVCIWWVWRQQQLVGGHTHQMQTRINLARCHAAAPRGRTHCSVRYLEFKLSVASP